MQIKFDDGSTFETTNPSMMQSIKEVILETTFYKKPKAEAEVKVKSAKKTKRFLLGSREWSIEDTVKVYQRNDDLMKKGTTDYERCKVIGQEFGRTPSAIYNRLHSAKVRNMIESNRPNREQVHA